MADVRRVIEIDVKTSAQAAQNMREIARSLQNMEKRFEDVEKAASMFGQRLVEFFSIRSVVGMIRDTAEAFDEMGKRSERLGVATEELSALTYQAKLANVTAEQLDVAMVKLNKSLAETDKEGSAGAKALRQLGVTATDPAKAFTQIAEGFANMEKGAKKTALAVDIFGKSGAQLIPMLNEGAAGIDRARAEAEAYGLIVRAEAVRASQQFNDAVTALGQQLVGFRNTAVTPLILALGDLADKFFGAGTEALDWSTKMKLAFSGEINLGKYFELRQELERLEAELENIPNRGFWQRFSEGPDKTYAEVVQRFIEIKKGQIKELDRLIATRDEIARRRAALAAGRGPGAGADSEATAADKERKAVEQLRKELDAIAESALKGAKGFSSLQDEADKFIATTGEGKLNALNKQLDRLAYLENSGAIHADLAAEARARLTRELLKLGDAYEQLEAELQDDADAAERDADRREALTRAFYNERISIEVYMEKLAKLDGAQQAAAKSAEDTKDKMIALGEAIQRSVEGWSGRATEAVINFAHNVETSFSKMVTEVLRELERMTVQMLVMDPLFKSFAMSLRTWFPGATGGGVPAAPSALGNAFGAGGQRLALAAGGVVNKPTFFRFAGGAGVMGEAGPEAILPLKRSPTGALGVEAPGGAGVTVNVINNAGADVGVTEGRDASGARVINVMVERAVQDAFARGRFDSLMSATYGVNRRGR